MVDKRELAVGREYMKRVARSLLQELRMLLVRTWGQPEFVRYIKRNQEPRLIRFDSIRWELQAEIQEAIKEMHPPRSPLVSEAGVIDELRNMLLNIHNMFPPKLLLALQAEAREAVLNRR
jgi:hypothetical protein